MAHAFDIQQDALRFRILRQVIEHVTEVDVDCRAGGDHGRKAKRMRLRPVHDGRAQGAGLRHQRQPAGPRLTLTECGIEPQRRSHQAQAVGSDQAHAVLSDNGQYLRFQRLAGIAGFTKAGRDDDRGAHTILAAGTQHVGYRRTRRGNHGKIDRARHYADAGVAGMAVDLLVFGIDGIHRAGKATLTQVGEDAAAHGFGALAGAKHGHGARLEQVLEVVLAHGGSPFAKDRQSVQQLCLPPLS